MQRLNPRPAGVPGGTDRKPSETMRGELRRPEGGRPPFLGLDSPSCVATHKRRASPSRPAMRRAAMDWPGLASPAKVCPRGADVKDPVQGAPAAPAGGEGAPTRRSGRADQQHLSERRRHPGRGVREPLNTPQGVIRSQDRRVGGGEGGGGPKREGAPGCDTLGCVPMRSPTEAVKNRG